MKWKDYPIKQIGLIYFVITSMSVKKLFVWGAETTTPFINDTVVAERWQS